MTKSAAELDRGMEARIPKLMAEGSLVDDANLFKGALCGFLDQRKQIGLGHLVFDDMTRTVELHRDVRQFP